MTIASCPTTLLPELTTPIVYVIPSLGTGGAELQTINQINYLFNQGVDVSLIVLSSRTQHLDRIDLPGHKIKVCQSNPYDTLGKGFISKLYVMVHFLAAYIPRKRNSHLILVLEESHIVGRLLKLFRPRLMLHCYFRDIHYSPNKSVGVKIYNRINNLLSKFTDTSSLFISQAVKKDIESKFYTVNSITLPNSLPNLLIDESEGMDFIERKKLYRPYIILVPGRLHIKKGHLPFLSEFTNFIKDNKLDPSDIILLIAGEGPEKSRIEQGITSLQIENYCYMCGELSQQLLLSLYKCSNLVVIPSLREGFGNVAIEGLMQQTLMLVSGVDGLAEIIQNGRNGYTFDISKEGDASSKLSYIYTHQDHDLISPDVMYEDYQSRYTLESQMNRVISHLLRCESKVNNR